MSETTNQEIKNTDHVVLANGTFVCRHCGQTYAMYLPCPITVMVAAMNAYADSHKNCTHAVGDATNV